MGWLLTPAWLPTPAWLLTPARALLRYFQRLAATGVAPGAALARAARGQWNAVRDAMILIAVAAVAVHTVALARVFVVGWDLGFREGINEISWSLGRRLSPDLLLLLGMVVVVVAPLRISGRLSFDRALALAAACWMPPFLTRLAGTVIRTQLGYPPARFPHAPEWWIALGWGALLVAYALFSTLGSPREATPPHA